MNDQGVNAALRAHAARKRGEMPMHPSLDDVLKRALNSKQPTLTRTSLLVAAVVATVAAVAITTEVMFAHPRHRSHIDAGLTAAQRQRATDIAQQEAWTSSARGRKSSVTEWPSSVDSVAAAVMSAEDASQLVNRHLSDATRVLVVRLTGRFSIVTPGPPGHSNAIGHMITALAPDGGGPVSDATIELNVDRKPLPHQTVLFVRR